MTDSGPWPRKPFPEKVAGFPFGATPGEFIATCNSAGLEGALLDQNSGACSGVAGAMPFEVSTVVVFFCDGRACEYTLHTRQGAGDADRLLELLEDRYGNALDPPGYHPKCEADPPSRRFMWGWKRREGGRGLGAMLRLIFDCGPDESPAERSAVLYYDDETGTAWRAQQGKDQEQNY